MRVLRRLLAGLLLASFGAALGLGAMEAGVRLLHLVPSRFWNPDPLLGTWHIPGKSGWWTQEEHEFVVPVTISSAGLRDVEHPPDKPAGVRRVLLLGDSYIEALQVRLEEMLGRQLEQRLNEAGSQRYEVLSMGVSGYGTASEFLYYRETGRKWKPDVVVLSFYPGNDVKNNSPTLEPALIPTYDDAGNVQRVIGKESGGEPKGLLGSWQTYQYFRKQIVTRNPTAARLLVGLGLLKQSAMRPPPMMDGVPVDYWVYAAKPPEEWEKAWVHSENLIRALATEVRKDGAKFALIVVTARDHVHADSWRQVLDTYPGMSEKQWDLEGPERRVLDFCRREKIACLHLSPIFAAHLGDGERLHFVHDGHWTAAGHALVAKSLAAFLNENGLIQADKTEVR